MVIQALGPQFVLVEWSAGSSKPFSSSSSSESPSPPSASGEGSFPFKDSGNFFHVVAGAIVHIRVRTWGLAGGSTADSWRLVCPVTCELQLKAPACVLVPAAASATMRPPRLIPRLGVLRSCILLVTRHSSHVKRHLSHVSRRSIRLLRCLLSRPTLTQPPPLPSPPLHTSNCHSLYQARHAAPMLMLTICCKQ
jgi:hypothetical protein